MSHFIIGNIMELIKEKKDKRPSKKGLINEIETLDSNKDFNLLSLTRTNIDNLVVIRNLLKGVK
jgi:hypothetical protein